MSIIPALIFWYVSDAVLQSLNVSAMGNMGVMSTELIELMPIAGMLFVNIVIKLIVAVE